MKSTTQTGGIASRRKSREKLNADILLLTVVLSENCFGLIDSESIHMNGVFNLDIIWQLTLLLESTNLYLQSRKVEKTAANNWQDLVLLSLIVMCFVAAWRCNVLTGQPFIRGLLPQRGFIIGVLSALLLRRPFKTGLVSVRRIIGGLIVLGCFASLLYLLQAAVGSTVTFIHVLTGGGAYGGLRIRISSALPDTAGILGFWMCIKQGSWRFAVPTVLALGVILFVSQGRLELITYLAVLLIVFLLVRGNAGTKTVVALICLASVILFSLTGYFGQIVSRFSAGFDTGSSDNTNMIREAGREYYDDVLSATDSELIGCGYPNTLWEPAAEMAGIRKDYLLVDNGIFAYRYVHGNLGVIIIVLTLASIIAKSYANRRNGLFVAVLAYFMFLTIPCANLAWWWWTADWQVLSTLFTAIGYAKPSNYMVDSEGRQ